jgi:transketolase
MTLDQRQAVGHPGVADVQRVKDLARFIRTETVRLIGIAKSGHFTSVFSCAEILAALYSGVMRLSDDPAWPERDRLILSKGHCAVGVYPILAQRGYFPADWLDGYTRLGSPLGDHPDMRRVPGIDFSSGSLGHGLSIGVGMAKAARMRGYDETRVYVLLGDQELNEGQVWEAAQAAARFGLGNLVAIVDRNQMGLDGLTEDVMPVEPIAGRFEAFGWRTHELGDGHDPAALLGCLGSLPGAGSDVPTCIVAHTVKGKGVRYMELSRTWHLGYLGPEDERTTTLEIANDA